MDDPRVVAAAAPYVRIRVRVPEAYLLVRPYDTTRPALLVLDADGRRVDSIALPGMGAPPVEPAVLARRLRAAQDAPAREIWRFDTDGADAARAELQAALAARKGIAQVAREDGAFRVVAEARVLDPVALAAAAASHGIAVSLREPVPVRVRLPDEGTRAIAALPGVWHVTRAPEPRAYVAALLLRPADLGETDLEARTYRLAGVAKGGTGARVAAAPLGVPGVLAVHADLFGERETVVARRGVVSWQAVRASFASAGCEAERDR